MVQGLKFLSKKGFHPQNRSNQKRVWEAQQEDKVHEQRVREREAQLQRERDDEELAQARGDAPKLRFLYEPPPGLAGGQSLVQGKEREDQPSRSSWGGGQNDSTTQSLTERQPGDDDAAAAFRRMLAGFQADAQDTIDNNNDRKTGSRFETAAFASTVLQGSTIDPKANDSNKKGTNADVRSELERAVGRKKESVPGLLTLEEQIQRFPALANAPRAKGMTATDVGVKFNPLGTQIRNVRCLACGFWGHSLGDRECLKTGWDPFASASVPLTNRNEMEDSKPVPKKVDRKSSSKRRHSRHSSKDDKSLSTNSDSDSHLNRKRKHRPRYSSDDSDRSYDRKSRYRTQKKHKRQKDRKNRRGRRNRSDYSDSSSSDDETRKAGKSSKEKR